MLGGVATRIRKLRDLVTELRNIVFWEGGSSGRARLERCCGVSPMLENRAGRVRKPRWLLLGDKVGGGLCKAPLNKPAETIAGLHKLLRPDAHSAQSGLGCAHRLTPSNPPTAPRLSHPQVVAGGIQTDGTEDALQVAYEKR